MLADLREPVKARLFLADRGRPRSIPNAGGKLRWPGIPTMADRIAQASLTLVLEPIFEANFQPSSCSTDRGDGAQHVIAETTTSAQPPVTTDGCSWPDLDKHVTSTSQAWSSGSTDLRVVFAVSVAA
jgi:hypothetical protein